MNQMRFTAKNKKSFMKIFSKTFKNKKKIFQRNFYMRAQWTALLNILFCQLFNFMYRRCLHHQNHSDLNLLILIYKINRSEILYHTSWQTCIQPMSFAAVTRLIPRQDDFKRSYKTYMRRKYAWWGITYIYIQIYRMGIFQSVNIWKKKVFCALDQQHTHKYIFFFRCITSIPTDMVSFFVFFLFYFNIEIITFIKWKKKSFTILFETKAVCGEIHSLDSKSTLHFWYNEIIKCSTLLAIVFYAGLFRPMRVWCARMGLKDFFLFHILMLCSIRH